MKIKICASPWHLRCPTKPKKWTIQHFINQTKIISAATTRLHSLHMFLGTCCTRCKIHINCLPKQIPFIINLCWQRDNYIHLICSGYKKQADIFNENTIFWRQGYFALSLTLLTGKCTNKQAYDLDIYEGETLRIQESSCPRPLPARTGNTARLYRDGAFVHTERLRRCRCYRFVR